MIGFLEIHGTVKRCYKYKIIQHVLPACKNLAHIINTMLTNYYSSINQITTFQIKLEDSS